MDRDAQAGVGHVDLLHRHHASEETSQGTSYDLITEVMTETWDEALRILGGLPSDPLALWTLLAKRVLTAVGEGERNPERLKHIALRFLES